ncbi:hypothetical protein ACRE_084500 [Hapsidospora chrysogenum ATCC 11550]|uniref:Uncharacterized protein n=1 Tax=Hapsidospora chrysogenum (strain ATCC 11550 / CBS 779.69 / DSM 880 / IAM 14645 / JCM 23072 / IMI 49137) TaxID=857340 RepID=A0A086SUS3_HAPC1|nr:hypothetical protein ACRE_084500 [Hapsidospora chrysogenum ATCC 11550]
MAVEDSKAVQLSLPLPRSLDTRIYIRLSTRAKAIMLSLTTASQDELGSAAPMGSFIYALPNKFDSSQPLATNLFPHEPTLEFTTRMAKLLARKAGLPVYVTNSISFANAGMGGTVEEEMEVFKNIVEVVLPKIKDAGIGATAVNGN